MGYVVSLVDRMKAELENLRIECEILERQNHLLAEEARQAQKDAEPAQGKPSE